MFWQHHQYKRSEKSENMGKLNIQQNIKRIAKESWVKVI